jgi:type I restriction enzyme S subunit
MTAFLGEVATFIRGITFKPADVVPGGTQDAVACMRTKNVQAVLDEADIWHVNRRFVRRSDQYLRTGDTLVSSANSWNLVGKCCWVPELDYSATFGGFISVLRAISDHVDAKYLYRWFSSARTQAYVRSFGRQTTNISNLDFERCLHMAIPLPSVQEQRQIVEILDQAAELRGKRLQALSLLGNLIQSIFIDKFGNAANSYVVPLRDVVSEFRYGTSNKSQSSGNPALRIPNVVGGEIDVDDLKLVPVTKPEFERLRLLDGDMLFVRTNGNPDYVGRCAVFTEESVSRSGLPTSEFIFASYLIRARLKPGICDPVYLREFLSGETGQRDLRSRSKTSAGQYNINVEAIGAIEVPLPPLTCQQNFASAVDRIDRLRQLHREYLAELDSLFVSLQEWAFVGGSEMVRVG